MKRHLYLYIVAFIFIIGSFFLIKQGLTAVAGGEENSPVYELELERWNIYNNGTHPIETTKGINSALQWAKEHGYKTFQIPAGTYLIAKGTQQSDPEARINMVSDMDLLLDEETILQKEANEFELYSVLYIGPNVRNVTVRGGSLVGDREDHDFSKKGPDTGGTHEWGNGIEIVGAENIVIDGVKIEKFTGDGIIVSGTTVTGSYITETTLESGGLDNQGNPIKADGKIRSNNREVTHFDNPAYDKFKNIHFWLPEGVNSGSKVDVFYYRKDGSFIKADKNIRFHSGESIIPNEADHFRAVFEAPSTKGVKVNRMTVNISRNVTIQNSDIGYNRRQGISLVGSDGVKIINNHIHHTNGTAPQSGIDIEPGFFPGRNTVIKGNTFTDNKIQIVLAYGENVTIEDNRFDQNVAGGVGVHAHKGFRGKVVVKDNIFNGSGLTLYPEKAEATANSFNKGEVKLLGKNIIFSDAELVDASLSIGKEPGQEISNVEIQHNGHLPGVLYIWDEPVSIKDVTIKAKTNGQGLIFGTGNSESVYERLTVEDFDRQGTVLPVGIYKKCNFNAGTLEINREGKYLLNKCTIKDEERLLTVNSTYGAPDVTIQNSVFEVTGNIGYGAAIYVLGAEAFSLKNSIVSAENNTEKKPLIKIGPYGHPTPTKVFGATVKGNTFNATLESLALDTSNSGTDAPSYRIEENTIYNAKLRLKENDLNKNNKLLKK